MIELDEGYYFGLGAFETILVKNSIAIFLEEHLERLNKSLLFLGVNKKVEEEDVVRHMKEKDLEDTILKISVSNKNLIYSTRKNTYTQEQYEKGFRVKSSEFLRNETSPLTYHKTLNYAENIVARQRAQAEQYDEALFINMNGEISEGSCSNIFFVKKGKLYTPAISSGALPGVFRKYICKCEEVTETSIKYVDYSRYDECFLTNSIMGIMRVCSINEFQFKQDIITRTLQAKYRAFY